MSAAIDQIINELSDRIEYLKGKVAEYALLPDSSLAKAWRIRLHEARRCLDIVVDNMGDE